MSTEAAELMLGLFMLADVYLRRRVLEGPPDRPRVFASLWTGMLLGLPLMLGLVTNPIVDPLLCGPDPQSVEQAGEELQLLADDLFENEWINPRIARDGDLYDSRIYYAVKQQWLYFDDTGNYFNKRDTQIDPGEIMRFNYFLDPWNNAFWIRMQGEQPVWLYSFGPNRRVDAILSDADGVPTPEQLRGDDIGDWLRPFRADKPPRRAGRTSVRILSEQDRAAAHPSPGFPRKFTDPPHAGRSHGSPHVIKSGEANHSTTFRGRTVMTKMLLPVALLLLTAFQLQAEERTIRVTAKSQLKVVPDEVYLDFRIESRQEELMEAKKANDELALKIFGIAKDHGIPSADVSVFDMDLAPVYKRNDDEEENQVVRKPIAFRYLRSMEVRMTDFKMIEPFLVECYKVGVQDLSGVSFRVSNQREHQFRARELAVTYCREKATHLTELTGMKIGAPISISEDVEESYEAGGFGAGGVFGASAAIDRPSAAGQAAIAEGRQETLFISFNSLAEMQEIDLVAPGQIEIGAEVTIVYEMTKDQ